MESYRYSEYIGGFIFMKNKETKIYKLRQEMGFTQVPNDFLRNPKISIKAKGMLSLLLSYPDDWVVYKSVIIKSIKESRTAVDTVFAELEDLGYIKKEKKRNADGTFAYAYYVSAVPTFNRCTFSAAEKPTTDNPQRIMCTYKEREEQTNTEKQKTEKEILVTADFDFLVSVVESGMPISPQQITSKQQEQLLDYGCALDKDGNIVALSF